MSPQERKNGGTTFWDRLLHPKKKQYPGNANFRDPDQYERVVQDFHDWPKRKGWLVGDGEVITTNPGGYTIGDSDKFVIFDGDEYASTVHEARLKRKP